jgi:hypothetical protein
MPLPRYSRRAVPSPLRSNGYAYPAIFLGAVAVMDDQTRARAAAATAEAVALQYAIAQSAEQSK